MTLRRTLDSEPWAVDFLLGFLTIDICNDDSAHTRGLKLLTSERDLLQELVRIQSSPALMQEYDLNREEMHKALH